MAVLAGGYSGLGQFEKARDLFDKAIRLSPRDPALFNFHELKSQMYFALRQYDQAIDSARQSIAIRPNENPWAHRDLVAALVFAGHEAEAKEALQRYLALPPNGPRTIAAWKALEALFTGPQTDPGYLEMWDRLLDGLRKAGMPEA
jgi:tetratricopeptide (TPR) repeat protein